MKILFSLTFYTPYISGLTLYVRRLGEALADKGEKVSVISMQYDSNLLNAEVINNVRVIRAKPLIKISKGYISWDWLGKCWQEVRKNDTVVINLPQFEGFIPAFLGKMLGKKVVVIYHCDVVLPGGFVNMLVNRFLDISNLGSLFLSGVIVTNSEDFATHSRFLSHFKKKVIYIYPPVTEPKIDMRVHKVFDKKIGKKPSYLIGFVGRIAADKGIEYLLESIPTINTKLQEKNQNFKVIIAGPTDAVGEEAYQKKIRNLIRNYKEQVVIVGSLKDEEMGYFYSLLEVLVLPSVNTTEAFGMVQVEAMIAGVPVVASDLPGVRIPIQKTGMGKIVPIKNSQKLAEAILEVIINQKRYVKDKKEIEKEFSLQKVTDFYERVIKI